MHLRRRVLNRGSRQRDEFFKSTGFHSGRTTGWSERAAAYGTVAKSSQMFGPSVFRGTGARTNRVPPLSPIANGVSPISVHEALTRDGSGKFPPTFEAGQWQPDGLVNSLSFAPWPPFGSRLHPGTSSGVFPTQPRNSRNRRIKAPRAAGVPFLRWRRRMTRAVGLCRSRLGISKVTASSIWWWRTAPPTRWAFCWATATELSKRWCPTERVGTRLRS